MTANKNIQTLEALRDQALTLMQSAGYPLANKIAVELDQNLPFMGYTTEKNGLPVIVVSGMALSGNGALNLLIHELSHVYRIQSGHPSHDAGLLTAVTAWVMHGRVVLSYQEKILHSILNNIQDLYADDISFTIFGKNENLNEFFMGWIHDPVKPTSIEKRWENAERVVSAAFAAANLERHHVEDTDHKMQKAIEEFLTKNEKHIVPRYAFFKNFMVDLPEKVTEKEFEKLLISYLSEFLNLTT